MANDKNDATEKVHNAGCALGSLGCMLVIFGLVGIPLIGLIIALIASSVSQ